MGPICMSCEIAYPAEAFHESCADARIFDEGGGWLFLGPQRDGCIPREDWSRG